MAGAEADLKAAADSAGTADRPATGSRLKLTRMRLDSAITRLNEVAKLLGALPADDPAVKALVERHASGSALARKIQAILGGGSTEEGEPAGTDPGPKLDYRQEQALKDARFSLRELEQCCAQAGDVVARLDGEGEPAVHADVKTALAAVEKGRQRYGYVRDHLGRLPADHPQVRPVVERTDALAATLSALESRLRAADAALQKLTGMENYPAWEEDFRMLQEFCRRYANFEALVQNPEELETVVREDKAVRQEIVRIARTYLPLVEQKTEPGAKLEKLFDHFQNQRRGFVEKLTPYARALPEKIDANLDEARRLADEAVANAAPAWFGEGSGIEQHFGYAEKDISVLASLDEARGKQCREKLARVRAEIEAKAESLRDQIIESNEPPPDLYAGEDRSEIVKLAADAWKELEKDAKVLGVRIPSREWRRVTQWRWRSGAFYKVDHSRLQVQLLVAADGGLAVIRAVNVYRNHLEGDAVAAYPMDAPGDRPRPQQILKAARIR